MAKSNRHAMTQGRGAGEGLPFGAVGAGRGPLNESRVTLLLTWMPAPMPSFPRDPSSKSCRRSLE
jgi:hypothetical protein